MTTETSRKLIEDLTAAIVRDGVRPALERYMVKDCVLHNPKSMKGREGWIAYAEDEMSRGATVTVKRMLADGDMVAAHLHLAFTDGSPELSVVDLWRIDNGKIVEHWDIAQEVPKTSAYGNTMF